MFHDFVHNQVFFHLFLFLLMQEINYWDILISFLRNRFMLVFLGFSQIVYTSSGVALRILCNLSSHCRDFSGSFFFHFLQSYIFTIPWCLVFIFFSCKTRYFAFCFGYCMSGRQIWVILEEIYYPSRCTSCMQDQYMNNLPCS